MEDGHDPGLVALDGAHGPERAEDVGLPMLVQLPLVGTGGDPEGLLDGGHGGPSSLSI